MFKNKFEGYYFKHQKGNQTVALIPGISKEFPFIQVITNKKSFNFKFDKIEMGTTINIGGCQFSEKGIKINTDIMQGEISYTDLTPIKYDIMGPFKFFPMQCRHGVVSMHHKIDGYLTIEGRKFDFSDGVGYIEKDSGTSFPKKYLWIHCNDFSEKCSIMASVAHIPFLGLEFMGCICAVVYKQKEYRFATYLGVKIVSYTENLLILKQGKYRLEIEIKSKNAHHLYAPKKGQMIDIIHESNSSFARFKLYSNESIVFELESENTSFEFSF
jgi:tocopherol cyclase